MIMYLMQDMRARFPATAHSMYYVDIIGNISTSNVRKTLSEVSHQHQHWQGCQHSSPHVDITNLHVQPSPGSEQLKPPVACCAW